MNDADDLEFCNQLNARAAKEIEAGKECARRAGERLEEMGRLLEEAKAAERAHDEWAARSEAHHERATQLLEECRQIREAVEQRITARESGGKPGKLEA